MAAGAQRITVQPADDDSASLGLLPYEDSDSNHAIDARRWILVYSELVEFVNELLQRLEAERGSSADQRRGDRESAELRQQLTRYQARLEFWYGRHSALLGLDVDPEGRVIRRREKSARLTGRELMLLTYLLSQPGRRFTAHQLADRAWRSAALPPEEVRTYIGRVRRKLASIEAPCRIETSPRLGYSLVFDE